MTPEELRIESRDDFQRVLLETLKLAHSLAARVPDFPLFSRIASELEAMATWTQDGRIPTAAERESIDVGLLAAREFESSSNREVGNLRDRLYALNAHFDHLK